jgi:hypothetical protein
MTYCTNIRREEACNTVLNRERRRGEKAVEILYCTKIRREEEEKRRLTFCTRREEEEKRRLTFCTRREEEEKRRLTFCTRREEEPVAKVGLQDQLIILILRDSDLYVSIHLYPVGWVN